MAPDSRDIRWYGSAVFAALPLLFLLIFQGINLYEKGIGTGIRVFEPSLIFAPIAALTGACGYAFALQCAQSSKKRIALLGMAIGALWTIGAVVSANLAFDTQRFMENPRFAAMLVQAIVLGAVLLPVAMVNCTLVRRYGRRSEALLRDIP